MLNLTNREAPATGQQLVQLRGRLHAGALVCAISARAAKRAEIFLSPLGLRVHVHKIGELRIDPRIGSYPRIVARFVQAQFVHKDSSAIALVIAPVAQANTQLFNRLHGRATHSVDRIHPVAHAGPTSPAQGHIPELLDQIRPRAERSIHPLAQTAFRPAVHRAHRQRSTRDDSVGLLPPPLVTRKSL